MQRLREDRGQATVEFALILPVLALCVAGVIWVGNVVLTEVRLEHAAREGARAAAVDPAQSTRVAQLAVRRTMPDARVRLFVDAEFVSVTVETEVAGLPLIGLGSRVLFAEVHMRREDILNP